MSATSFAVRVTELYNSQGLAVAVLLNRNLLNDLNLALGPAGAAIATNTTGVKSVNSVTYTLDGAFQTAKGATDPLWTLTGGVLAVASFRRYLLCIGSGGTASVIASTDSTVSAASCVYTTMPDGVCVFSFITVATDATHTFTPGTTALNATGITTTFADGTDKFLLPLIADAASGNEVLALGGGSASPLG